MAKPPQGEPEDSATDPANQPPQQSPSKGPSGRMHGYQKMLDEGGQPDPAQMFNDMKRTLNDALNKKPGQGHDTDPYSMFTFRSPHMREQHNMFVRDYLTNMNEHLDYLKRQLDKYKSSPMLYKKKMSEIMSWWQTKMNNIRQLGVMTNILHQTDPSKPPSVDSKGKPLFPEYTPGPVNTNVQDPKTEKQQKSKPGPSIDMGEDDMDPPPLDQLTSSFSDQSLSQAGITRQDLTNLLQAGDLVPKPTKSRDGSVTWSVKPASGRDGVIKAWRDYNKAKASGQQVQPPPIPFKQPAAPKAPKAPKQAPAAPATPAPAPTSPAAAPAAPAAAPAAPTPAPAAPAAPQSAPGQPATKPVPMQDLSPEEQQEKFNAAKAFLKRYKLNDAQVKRLLDSGVFDMVKTAPAEGKSVAQWKAVTNAGKGKKLSDYINMVKQSPPPKQGMAAVDDILERRAARGTAWYRKGH